MGTKYPKAGNVIKLRQYLFLYLLIFCIVAIDQGNKFYFLWSLELQEGVRQTLLPFLDIVLVWNKGISYGLFQQNTQLGAWILVGAKFFIVIGLLFWLHLEKRALAQYAISFIIGGALGNMIDRYLYGAVADFYLLHWQNLEWYVFNLADVAIVIGVALLIYEEVVKRPQSKGSSTNA